MDLKSKIKSFFKKKHEFSKLFCGLIASVIGAVGVYSIVRYYSLCKLAIKTGSAVIPDATLAVTCVSVLLGAFLSYCLYQFGLKNSRNKYGIDGDGQPYKEKIKEYLDEVQEETSTEAIGFNYEEDVT